MSDDLTNLNWLHSVTIFPRPQSPPPVTASNSSSLQKKLLVSPRTNVSQLSSHHSQLREFYRTSEKEKPPFSYAALICLAMRDNRGKVARKKMTLRQIYRWIRDSFAYYRVAQDRSWQVQELFNYRVKDRVRYLTRKGL